MTLTRRAGSVLLKAPCISFARKVGRSGQILREPAGVARASDAGWRMANRTSIVDRFSTAPNWVLLRAPTLSAASAVRFAINFSNTLLMLLSRDIGRYDLGRLGPRRPPFGMTTQLACFYAFGKHPLPIEAVKRSGIKVGRWGWALSMTVYGILSWPLADRTVCYNGLSHSRLLHW